MIFVLRICLDICIKSSVQLFLLTYFSLDHKNYSPNNTSWLGLRPNIVWSIPSCEAMFVWHIINVAGQGANDLNYHGQLEELHVYLVPLDCWQQGRNLATKTIENETISLGFVRWAHLMIILIVTVLKLAESSPSSTFQISGSRSRPSWITRQRRIFGNNCWEGCFEFSAHIIQSNDWRILIIEPSFQDTPLPRNYILYINQINFLMIIMIKYSLGGWWVQLEFIVKL